MFTSRASWIAGLRTAADRHSSADVGARRKPAGPAKRNFTNATGCCLHDASRSAACPPARPSAATPP